MYAQLPKAGTVNENVLAEMDLAKEIITGVRGVRAQRNLPQKDALRLLAVAQSALPCADVIIKLANLSEIVYNAEKDPAAAQFMVGTLTYCVPLADNIDVEAEIEKLTKEPRLPARLQSLSGEKTLQRTLCQQRPGCRGRDRTQETGRR